MSKPLFKRPKKKKVFNKRKSYQDEGSEDDVIGTTAAEALAAATSKDIENKAMTPSSTATNIPNNVQSEESESESEYSRIQIIKKTRKIKNQFRTRTQSKSKPKKMKLNPMQQKELEQEKKDAEEEEVNRDLKQRLEGNFAITGKSTADTDEDGNVLTKKHRLAMEQYIQSQMQKQNPGASHGQGSNLLPLDEDGKEMEVKNTDDLYQRLLLESNELGTRDNNNNGNSNSNGNGEERSSIEVEQEDVGAGGAMLGGTGIAEVILPVDDKIRAARETEVAAAKLEKRRALYKLMHASNKDAIDVEIAHDQRQDEYVDLSQMLPMNFGSGPGKGRNNKSNGLQQQQLAPQIARPKSPLIPSGAALNKNSMSDIGSSYAHNFRLHNEEWITKKKQENALQIQEVVQPENEVDGSRVGFEAKRGLKAQKDGSSGGDGRKFQRAHDDMVYKKFVSREFHNNKK